MSSGDASAGDTDTRTAAGSTTHAWATAVGRAPPRALRPSETPESAEDEVDVARHHHHHHHHHVLQHQHVPVVVRDEVALPLHVQHMLAGGAAGIAEHVALFPVDTVKTHMQVYQGQAGLAQSGLVQAVRRIAGHGGGMRALWRGVGAVALSAGPAHALYFSLYEAARAHLLPRLPDTSASVATASAGALATIISDGVMAPFDVVKQRMQVQRGYRSVLDTMLRVYRVQGGWRTFYRGYPTTLVMNIPFSATYFTAYESMHELLLGRRHPVRTTANVAHESFGQAARRTLLHFVSGGVAGAAAATITNPLDVVRTRLQTQGEPGARKYRGMWAAFRSVAMEEGARGLFAGVRPRVLFHAPAGAVAWTTFEFVKRILHLDENLDALNEW